MTGLKKVFAVDRNFSVLWQRQEGLYNGHLATNQTESKKRKT